MPLDLNTLNLNKHPLRYRHNVSSTMTEAKSWLADEPSLTSGAVVLADEQRAGKGRMGRAWLTPPDTAIAMSLILKGDDLGEQPTMLAALAVSDAIRAFDLDAVLKWPNDILIHDKKVCGILAESVLEGNRLQAQIIGIGINVSVDFSDSPLANIAASLNDFSPRPIPREALINRVINRFDHWLGETKRFQRSPYAPLAPSPLYLAWKDRLITLGKAVSVTPHDNAPPIHGTAEDVERDGALILRLKDGSRQRFLAGDVSLRRSSSSS